MNKTFKQLKEKQRVKISEWMYSAYKKQVEEGLTNDEAIMLVMDKIEKAEIWIPDHEMVQRYNSKKKQYRNRLLSEKVPQHIFLMEKILDKAQEKMDSLEKQIEEYREFQLEIKKLESYYTSQQWKNDFLMDEKGEFPDRLKRGVLSEDGIYNVLERNRELLERIGTTDDEDKETGDR
nr:DUF4298 domain-containing protein [Butyrivibrio sp. WCD3002]